MRIINLKLYVIHGRDKKNAFRSRHFIPSFIVFGIMFHKIVDYYYLIIEFIFSLPANSAVPKPNTPMRVNDQRKLTAWAINPIMGGPIKNPRKPMVDTAAKAVLAERVVERPANPYTMGTTEETPKPTRKKPAVAVNK